MKPLHWLAVLSLLAVFVAPPTRRAAYEQTRLVLGLNPPEAFLFPSSSYRPNPAWLERRQNADFRRVAARHPDDIGLQMAAAVTSLQFSFTEISKGVVAGLRPLLANHPNSPAIYAQLLLYGSACLGGVGDEYKAAKPEFQPLRDAIDPKPAHPSPRVKYADYLSWAAVGERLDPDNAFFPAMRSVWLFEMARKQEALAAIERASFKGRWEDYGGVLQKGMYDLPREAYGRTDPMAAVTAGVFTFPMYAVMREAARTAMEEAKVLERAGHAEAGLRIRRSLWRLARIWREQSRDLIGAMTASAVGSVALGDLGGKVAIDPKWPNEKKRQVRRDTALNHLRRTGHLTDADWIRADIARRDEMHAIIKAGLDKANAISLMVWAMGTWGCAALFLDVALWLALLAVAASWVADAQRRQAVRVIVVFALVLVLFTWQARGIQGFFAPSPLDLGPFATACMAVPAIALAVPLLLAILMGLTAFVRRKPFLATASAWLRASLLPTACIVALLFVGASIWGVKPQRAWREYTAAQVTGEGPYYARLVGKQWPL